MPISPLARTGPGRRSLLRLDTLEDRLTPASSYYYRDGGVVAASAVQGSEEQIRPGTVHRVTPGGIEVVYTDPGPGPGLLGGLAVLPDGDLVINRANRPYLPGASYSLVRVDLDPNTPEGVQVIAAPGRVGAVASGPDGAAYFTATPNGSAKTSVYRLSSNGTVKRVYTEPLPGELTDLAVLQDGDLVYGQYQQGVGSRVIRVDLDPKTSDKRTVTPVEHPVQAVAVGPDASSFYFLDAGWVKAVSIPGSEEQEYFGGVFRVGKSGVVQVAPDPGTVSGMLTDLEVLRDGDLAVVRANRPYLTGTTTSLYRIDLDPATPETVTNVVTTVPVTEYISGVAAAAAPDLKLLDVTADPGPGGIQKLEVRIRIDGAAVGPDYKFQVFLSADETFERGADTLLAGEFVVDGSATKKKYRQVTDEDGEKLTITLAQPAPLTKTERFLIVVADAEETVDEADEPIPPAQAGGEEIKTGKNNTMFAIPLFKGGEKAGFRKDTGAFQFNLPENDANDPIQARISRGTAAYNALVDLDAAWLGPLPSPRSFKDEEPTAYAGSDHKGDPALVAPLAELGRLIDLVSADDRFAGAKAPLPMPLRITEAFDEQGEHSLKAPLTGRSRHFEGRAIDIGVTGKALERVLGLGLLAGFSWVNAEGNHAHFSHTGTSAVASTEVLQHAVTSGADRSLIQAPRAEILQSSLTTIVTLTDQINNGVFTPEALQAKKAERKATLKQFIKDVDKGLANGQIVKKLPSATPGQGSQEAKIGNLLKFNANELLKTF